MNERNKIIYKKAIKDELTLIKNAVNSLENLPIKEQMQITQIIDNSFHGLLFLDDFDITSFYEGKKRYIEEIDKAEMNRINFYKNQFDKLYGDL